MVGYWVSNLNGSLNTVLPLLVRKMATAYPTNPTVDQYRLTVGNKILEAIQLLPDF